MQRYIIFFIISLLALSGCADIEVSQDYRLDTTFHQFQSFDWQPGHAEYHKDVRQKNPLLHHRFRETIPRAFEMKGFRRSSQPDFLIAYEYSITTKIESSPHSIYWGYGPYHHRRGYSYSYGTDIYQYDVGMLAIEVYAGASNAILWRGIGTHVVKTHLDPGQMDEMVRKLVWEIVNQFPPQ